MTGIQLNTQNDKYLISIDKSMFDKEWLVKLLESLRVEELARKFDFDESVIVSFENEKTKNILQQKIAYYQSRIDFFEQKYALKFSEFCEKFSSIKNHSITEKEDDSMIWETSLDVVESYKKDLMTFSL
jgi:hypothetical protein